MNPDEVKRLYAAGVNTTRRYLPTTDASFDDLVQEYVIRAWQAGQGRRDPLTYGKVAGANHLPRILTGRQSMLGSEHAGSKVYDLARKTARRGDMVETETIPAADTVERDAVSAVDLDRMLSRLEGRDRVIAAGVAFQRTWEQIGSSTGLAANTVRKLWFQQIKPTLREAAA